MGLMQAKVLLFSAIFFLTANTFVSGGAGAAERERLEIITGMSYQEGDFGTDVNSTTIIAPFTVRYLGDKFDLGLTIPFIYLDSAEAVTIVGGQPERVRKDPASLVLDQLAPGVGDLYLKGRYYLFEDPGLDSYLPAITPFAAVKFPTANSSEGLGTGKFDYGFGLDFDKQIHDFFLFASTSYTFIGEPSDTNLRDKISVGGGCGYQFLESLSASVELAWSRSLVVDTPDPTDIITSLTWDMTDETSFSPFVSFGLTEGSPDFGVGFAVSHRFLRF